MSLDFGTKLAPVYHYFPFAFFQVVLCAMSPYFEAMFTHDMVETRGGIVTLYDLEPAVFETLLTFMYTGNEVVHHGNAEQIFRASSMLQIACLQARCEEFLIDQVSYENCVGIWNIAKAHNCRKLAAKSLATVLENFPQVSSSLEFLKLEIDEVICILKADLLRIPNEEDVCDAAMAWLKHDVTVRKQHLPKLLEALRLPLVSSDYLFSMTEDEHFDFSVECNNILKDTFKFHSCPAKRQTFTAERFVQRKFSSRNDVLVIVGGLLKTMPRFQTTKEVVCYSFQQEKWYYLPSLPYDPGYEFAVCSHGSDIYISGGWLKLQGVAVYKTEKNKWKTLDTMINGRCGHVMVALTNSIFVLGGRDGKAPAMTNIEKFNLKTKKWQSAGELFLGIRSMSASVSGENIFVFGGITETDKDTDTIQSFDTRHGTATIIGDLPFTCRLTRTIKCDEQIYIILPDGRMILFDSKQSRKRLQSLSELSTSFENEEDQADSSSLQVFKDSPLPSPTSPASFAAVLSNKDSVLGSLRGRIQGFNQHHFEAIQHRGKLLLAGGKAPDNTILKTVVTVDPANAQTLSTISMPSARWCFGCVKTVIHKDFLNNGISDDKDKTDDSSV